MSDLRLFHGPNAGYVLDLYEQYQQDPASVPPEMQALFAEWAASNGDAPNAIPQTPPSSQTSTPTNGTRTTQHAAATTSLPSNGAPVTAPAAPMRDASNADNDSLVSAESFTLRSYNNQDGTMIEAYRPAPDASGASFPVISETGVAYDIPDIVNAARLVRFIREIGHLAARLDPLGSEPPGDPALELEPQGLTPEMLKAMPPSVVMTPLAEATSSAYEAVELLREVYCGSIGYDDDQVQVHAERQWMRQAAEDRRFFVGLDDDYKRELLNRLIDVETFERFLHTTYVGQKRFSLEGNDMLVPILDTIISEAAHAGIHEVVMGMAHRGRLNVLAHTLGKPYSAILSEFQGQSMMHNRATYLGWTGDVKYHLGARRAYRGGGAFEMPVTLVPNPSHLEFVNPVTEGRARAAQELRGAPGEPEHDPTITLPILIHGDASFPGQGVVAETLNMSRLKGYTTGGTIHIIINNQIGFTTDSHDSRSTLYAGDLAKGFEMPVLHVNADDPLACIAAVRMAWAYREKFGKDCLIDLVGYRRWGHNEGDEPGYTQPMMYEKITNHPTVREIWARTLEAEGVVTAEEVSARVKLAQERLQSALREVETRGRIDATVAVSAAALLNPPVKHVPVLSVERLHDLNEALMTFSENFTPHPKLERSFQKRRDALQPGGTIDWAHAETLAFASILSEGTPIRLTGQDAERGTFSQRHIALHDAHTGERLIPLQHVPEARSSFAVYNSPLSEAAALGFEYGFSIHAPETLVVWEAQFGDFANGAQVIIDQFIVSGYAKWGQQPSLVLLLPHGYEGQGPDHSSARLERFLQLAADNNLRVVNCTTAAQYFHLLRRQATLLQSDPRPLIVMTPKSLLRHPMAASGVEDLSNGRFLPVLIPETTRESADKVTRLILCSGKVYVDLMSKARTDAAFQVPEFAAVARIEELYPFPTAELQGLVSWYRNLKEIVWLQEEPANMGAWSYMRPRLRELLDHMNLPGLENIAVYYCGRAESASTAEGDHHLHQEEQERILRNVVQGIFEKHHASI